MIPTDRSGWKALDELSFRSITSSKETGTIYTVEKVGFVLASRESADEIAAPNGKIPLPTVTVKDGSGSRLCRLPRGLTAWAVMVVEQVHETGDNPFPCLVEFCVLNGRATADFVVD